MLYRVELWEKDIEGRGFKLSQAMVVGNLKVARMQAAQWLPAQPETNYSAKWARHPWVTIWEQYQPDAKKPKGRDFAHDGKVMAGVRGWLRRVEYIDTPIYYVPSVGELGYTP